MLFFCRRFHGISTTIYQSSNPTSTSLSATRSFSKARKLRRKALRSLSESPPVKRKSKPQDIDISPRRNYVRAMLSETDLRVVVDMFKESTERKWFRKRVPIYNKIIRRLFCEKKFSWIEEILEEQKKFECIKFEGFAARIIRLYGESRMFGHAQKTFDEMPKLNCRRTVKSVNAVLGAGNDSGKFDQVETMFRKLYKALSINPNVISYNIALKALCQLGSLDDLISIVYEMERTGLKPDSITFSTILNGFYKNERLSDGGNAWKMMEDRGIVPTVGCYNAKLRGLVSKNRLAEAVELYKNILAQELKPDIFTFNFLIKGFSEGGNLEQAKKWYQELLAQGCIPDKVTFFTLLPFACEKGDMDWGLQLCTEAITRRRGLHAMAVQGLVDGLVKESKVEEAKLLEERVQQSGGRYRFALKLGLDDT